MNPVAANDGKGFESFRVKDPDGWDLQISNGKGLVKSRKATSANAKLSEAAPFEATGWKTVWLDQATFSCQFGYQLANETVQKLRQFAPVHSVRDRGVGGSNPLAPTSFLNRTLGF